MRETKSQLKKLRRTLVASAIALIVAGPSLVGAAESEGASFKPTMADYLAVYDALQNYRFGVEKHDQKALARAFWEDGANIAVPSPGMEIRMPLDGSPPRPPPGMSLPTGGPPPGAAPPRGLAPPPGPGGAGPNAPGGDAEGGVWHLPLDSYIHFESATRATHYEYFLSIYPQPEKKAAAGTTGNMMEARTSIVGWPGHYEDILEKRHGEWRILQRKSMINQK